MSYIYNKFRPCHRHVTCSLCVSLMEYMWQSDRMMKKAVLTAIFQTFALGLSNINNWPMRTVPLEVLSNFYRLDRFKGLELCYTSARSTVTLRMLIIGDSHMLWASCQHHTLTHCMHLYRCHIGVFSRHLFFRSYFGLRFTTRPCGNCRL